MRITFVIDNLETENRLQNIRIILDYISVTYFCMGYWPLSGMSYTLKDFSRSFSNHGKVSHLSVSPLGISNVILATLLKLKDL